MSSNRNHKNVIAFQKSNADRNARRRELYRLMPPEEKEILLARRRAKRAETRKHNLSESSINNDLATTSSDNSTIISNRKHKNMHVFLKSNTDTNARRRELYKLMPPEEKEILLARRRAKRAEIRKHNLSESSMNNDLPATSSSNSTIVSVAQNGILDVLRKGEREASHIGKQRILPLSFTGGPRDMRRRYMDAIALVQRFGKPDIFLTITCNPSWPEIEEKLISTDEVQNRPDLRKAYDIILDRVLSNKFGAFYIDGPGGTGKSFLYRALLATIRHKGFIALATASSGVAASLLPGGRTAHSRFKIPIDVNENFTCNISKQSSLASLIRDARLIVWDEISMAKKKMVEAFDLLLRDLMETNTLFGGKIVVFSGDFRQTLPVVRSGKKEDFIRESLLCSKIWNQLEKLQLSKNMRATKDPEFCEYLMRIGDGKEKTNDHGKIQIPHSLIIPFTSEKESLNLLFRNTYPDLYTSCTKTSFITSRAILTTKNDFVDEINDMLISQFPNTGKVYIAIDETIDPKDQSEYEDFLHTLNPTGLPPYKLTLKKNCPIMLLRNLNPSEGLCNGTRLICNDFKPHVISATISSGDFKNTHVFIPRIPLMTSEDEKLPLPFKRTQFPVRLCFAMTINKAQGQTLDFVGIYLREPVFSHGQLYVALSRATSSHNVKVLIRPPIIDENDDHSTYNVVYNEIIEKAFS
ncbi:uncharacterized protein LOC125826651 [Solanum verrucosum]|uniref:uncharacterized protein LOC125826651 n=1 Tax=Solanum verrucosum TaxID=315347 RepID=UPI0020D0473D|nr:uncharacterized protein LOC125826651 [Solanum verrucosum]